MQSSYESPGIILEQECADREAACPQKAQTSCQRCLTALAWHDVPFHFNPIWNNHLRGESSESCRSLMCCLFSSYFRQCSWTYKRKCVLASCTDVLGLTGGGKGQRPTAAAQYHFISCLSIRFLTAFVYFFKLDKNNVIQFVFLFWLIFHIVYWSSNGVHT